VEDINEIARRVGRALMARGWTIGVAESCTGGLVSHILTNISGSSTYFKGAVVAYANEIKRDVLGVPQALLDEWGAVSEPVAMTMARQVRQVLTTDAGLAVTGIAGPTGGTPQKPVGTVFIAASTPEGDMARHCLWDSDRLGNKELSARAVLELVLSCLSPH